MRQRNMSIEKTIDLSIKKAETGEAKTEKCFVLGERKYENYMDNETWTGFVDEMRRQYPAAYEEYGKGSGDELGIKKIGQYPPKMASYGSSSRMIYMLSRDVSGFCFEKKLPITVGGGIANMDGYFYSEGIHYYVEAKCREPYYRKSYVIDKKYEDLYRWLDQDENVDFNCKITDLNEQKMKVRFLMDGTALSHFDIKQMICHLLGIATAKLNQPTEEKTKFLYLLFNPTRIELVDRRYQEQILSIYETEVAECEGIPFAELYAAIVRYLYRDRKVGKLSEAEMLKIANNFSFSLCDQETYLSCLGEK